MSVPDFVDTGLQPNVKMYTQQPHRLNFIGSVWNRVNDMEDNNLIVI